jgi:DEAD/DEAH box helicase domain-containing protein
VVEEESQLNLVFFDLETQKLFRDVGGRNPGKLLLACAVTYSSAKSDFTIYWEADVQRLVDELKSADKVVGFNIREFDYEVLRPYQPAFNFAMLPTLDLFLDIRRVLNFGISLDSIAKATLGSAKTADGIQSVEWFQTGQKDKVAQYCKEDVEITRKIYEFGREYGFVHYFSKLGSKLKIAVNWR